MPLAVAMQDLTPANQSYSTFGEYPWLRAYFYAETPALERINVKKQLMEEFRAYTTVAEIAPTSGRT